MNRIDDANIAAAEILQHRRRGAAFPRGYEQMHMIGHQHESMDCASAAAGSLGQAFEIEAPIHVAKEAGCAIVAALDDMERGPGNV